MTALRPPNGPSAFAVPAFRRLWLAGAVSDAGDWLLFIALPLLVLRLTGSAMGTALAFLLEIAPAILLGPVAGRLADRVPRRGLMVVVALAQAAALPPLLLVHDAAQLPVVYGVIVAQASLAALFEPAKNALLPTLVGQERILSANALVGLNGDLGRLIGGPVGGVLFGLYGIGPVALVDLVTYVVAAALVATVPREPTRPSRRPAAAGASRPGALSSVLRRPGVRGPMLLVLVAAVAQGMFVVLFVFFVTDVLRGPDAEVGLLRGVQAVGAIGAGLALGTGRLRLNVSLLTAVGTGAFAVLTLVTWNLSFLTHATAVYVVLFAAVGAPAVLVASGLMSRLQGAATDADRGTVFAAAGIAQAAGLGVGLVVAGSLQDVAGTVPLLEVQAGLYVVAALLAVRLLRPARVEPEDAGPRARSSGSTPTSPDWEDEIAVPVSGSPATPGTVPASGARGSGRTPPSRRIGPRRVSPHPGAGRTRAVPRAGRSDPSP
jgi:MFS family permease